MAIPISINELINKRIVESTRIEFQADWNPEPILHTICAFANDIDNMGGGYIIVGVDEKNGSPVFPVKGIEKDRVDGIEKKLREYCHYIEPFYQPVAEPFLYDDKYVLVIWVSGGFGRPYKAAASLGANRSEKNTIYAKQVIQSSLLLKRKNYSTMFHLTFHSMTGQIPPQT